jgi:hypothetical protein
MLKVGVLDQSAMIRHDKQPRAKGYSSLAKLKAVCAFICLYKRVCLRWTLTVLALDSNSKQIRVFAGASLFKVKEMVQIAWGVPIDEQVLLIEGSEDPINENAASVCNGTHATLRDLGLTDNCTLYLLRRDGPKLSFDTMWKTSKVLVLFSRSHSVAVFIPFSLSSPNRLVIQTKGNAASGRRILIKMMIQMMTTTFWIQ